MHTQNQGTALDDHSEQPLCRHKTTVDSHALFVLVVNITLGLLPSAE